jgi:hypothetical protein
MRKAFTPEQRRDVSIAAFAVVVVVFLSVVAWYTGPIANALAHSTDIVNGVCTTTDKSFQCDAYVTIDSNSYEVVTADGSPAVRINQDGSVKFTLPIYLNNTADKATYEKTIGEVRDKAGNLHPALTIRNIVPVHWNGNRLLRDPVPVRP